MDNNNEELVKSIQSSAKITMYTNFILAGTIGITSYLTASKTGTIIICGAILVTTLTNMWFVSKIYPHGEDETENNDDEEDDSDDEDDTESDDETEEKSSESEESDEESSEKDNKSSSKKE